MILSRSPQIGHNSDIDDMRTKTKLHSRCRYRQMVNLDSYLKQMPEVKSCLEIAYFSLWKTDFIIFYIFLRIVDTLVQLVQR